MKRLLAIIITLCMLSFALVSCLDMDFGSADTEPSQNDNPDAGDETKDQSGLGSESDGTVGSLKFSLLSDGTYGVAIGDAKNLEKIIIPSTYDEKPVTTVMESGFTEGVEKLETVVISDGITTIQPSAFEGCGRLKYITVPSSVTSIGARAFSGCNRLSYSKFDNGYYIGNGDNPHLVFMKLAQRTAKTVQINENTRFIYDEAFIESERLSALTIPDSVTSLGVDAFRNCKSLKTVTMSNSVTTISKGAFQKCPELESVTLSNAVTTIGPYAFFNCEKLQNIEIPDSVTCIEIHAFYKCFAFETATFEDPNGWGYLNDDNSLNELSATGLSDIETAALWLTLTYTDYVWVKN